jgi:hypothetical protein
MAGAQFTFASMIHRGFLADQNATTEVTVAVPGKEAITRQVPMMTPGDIIGIPSRQVIRCTPVNGLIDAEPNYLATIEFDAPDLPWMFSRKPATGPIQPWIMLAVVDVTDLAADPLFPSPVGTQLTVAAAQLPNPAEAWMWAHGQLLGTDTVPGDPARSLSRLVSSRKLEPNRRYLACVVPVFAAGKAAGLGTDPGDARTSMDFAWDPGGGDVTLPVYCFWRFGTGPNGDFEALVRRLHGVPLPSGLGKRKLLLDYPLTGLPDPDPDGASVELQVALRPPGERPDDIRPLVGASYLDALRSRLVDAGYDVSLLASNPDAPPPAVGPPVYGQLAVGATATAANLATVAPPWVRETNVDPRLRVAAGLGGEVVRQNQDRYLEEAWKQVGDVVGANTLRRRGEYSMAASATLHRKWISRLSPVDLVTSTAPVHARVFVSQNLTITGRLRRSPLPPSIVSVEYRRVTRARGNRAGATAWRTAVGPEVLASRSAAAQPLKVAVALDTIDTLEVPSRVWGLDAAPSILGRLVPDLDQTGLTAAQAATQLDSLTQLDAVDFATADEAASHAGSVDAERVLTAVGMLPVAMVLGSAASPPPGAPVAHPAPHAVFGTSAALSTPAVFSSPAPSTITPITHAVADVIAEQPALITHGPTGVMVDSAAVSRLSLSSPASVTISPSVFGDLITGTFTEPAAPVRHFALPARVAAPLKQQMFEVAKAIIDRQIVRSDAASLPEASLAGGFDSLRRSIVAALDPTVTMVRMVNHRISALTDAQAEGFDDIMAAPDLSEPTYQALAAISHDWLLPGIDTLPPDTTTLVESNRTFISGFLVGMNHEIARELLWREYPTDQRGTYFRQFWARRNTGDPTDQHDLQHRLHQAPDLTLEQLGEKAGQAASPLVLVVKGDLVRRYPGMLVTAAKTKKSGSIRTLDPATEIQPDFMARLEPDVLLVGFDKLTAADVWVLGSNEDTAWWFFFAEHFTEPRFGLDEPAAGDPATFVDWSDASWANAVVDAAGRLGADSFIVPPLPKSKPGTPPGPNYDWHGSSSAIAWILLQYPFRRGVRGTDLLPPMPVP